MYLAQNELGPPLAWCFKIGLSRYKLQLKCLPVYEIDNPIILYYFLLIARHSQVKGFLQRSYLFLSFIHA